MKINDFIKYKSKEYNVRDIERKLLYDTTDAVHDAVHVFSVLEAKERSSDSLDIEPVKLAEICNYIDDCLTNKIVSFEECNTFYILGALWKSIPRSRKTFLSDFSCLNTVVMNDQRFKEEYLPFTMLVNSSVPCS